MGQSGSQPVKMAPSFTNPTSSHSRLLELPIELQLSIYAYVLPEPYSILQDGQIATANRGRILLLQVCRSIRQICLGELFRERTFCIEVGQKNAPIIGVHLDFAPAIPAVGRVALEPEDLKFIRRYSVVIDVDGKCRPLYLQDKWNHFTPGPFGLLGIKSAIDIINKSENLDSVTVEFRPRRSAETKDIHLHIGIPRAQPSAVVSRDLHDAIVRVSHDLYPTAQDCLEPFRSLRGIKHVDMISSDDEAQEYLEGLKTDMMRP